MQRLTITTESQLRALFHTRYGVHLLGQFREEATVSQVAERLGEAPSKVAYHVTKLERLGFLQVVRLQGRQRYLMLAAQQVNVPAALLETLARENLRAFLTGLVEAYLASPGGEVTAPEPLSVDLLRPGLDLAGLAGVPNVQFRSVVCSRRTFEETMQAAWETLLQSPVDSEGELFTLALLGFRGSPLPMQTRENDR